MRYDVTGKPGQEFSEKKIDIFYDSNMLIDVCTSFLGLSSSASQLGMVKHIQGLRNGFHLGVAHSNKDFEKVDFQKYL